MAISWKRVLLAALAAILAVVVYLIVSPSRIDGATISRPNVSQVGGATSSGPVSYEELTRIVGPVAI
jgi:hypothetical protein